MNNPKTLALLTIIFWAFGGILTRLISIDSPLLSLTVLFLFTFITFFIYALVEYKNNFLSALKKVNKWYIVFGLFGYFFYYLGLVQSFHLFNSASETTILNYSFPIFTVLFTELTLRKSAKNLGVKLIEYSGIVLGFFAIIILATKGNIFSLQITNIPALLWGLSAGAAYGLFSVYSSKVAKEQQTMFLLIGIASSLIASISISFGTISQIIHLSPFIYIVSAIAAFIVNGLGYIMWIRANRLAKELHISISSIASLMFVLPVISLTLISLFFKETKIFQPYFLLCLLFLLISTLLCQKPHAIALTLRKMGLYRAEV